VVTGSNFRSRTGIKG